MTHASDIADSVFMVCTDDGALTHLGSAWPCALGLALTAWHVVSNHASVVLAASDGTEAKATCIDHNGDFDVALLSFDPRGISAPPLRLNDDGDWRLGDTWSGFGHPIGFPSGFPVDGTVSSPGVRVGGHRRVALNCMQGPKPEIRGLSGSPVLDAQGNACGLVVGYPKDLAQVTLFATRLDDAWKHLAKWRHRTPAWQSHGRITRYLHQKSIDLSGPTYRTPFLRRASPQLSNIFVAPRFRSPRNVNQMATGLSGQFQLADSLLEQLAGDTRSLVIRGDPGTGKSVLLRWLTAQAAEDWRERRKRAFVPVIVHASLLARADYQSAMDLALRGHEFALPAGASWLLMIDGLDEVVDLDDRRRVIDRLRHHGPLVYRGSHVRTVLASRPLAMLDEFPPSQALHFVLQPFSEAQLEAFAHAWFDGDLTGRTALAFMEEVRLSRLEGLASIPALATMAAAVFERSESKTLPRKRSELYDRFVELMLAERAAQVWAGFVSSCQQTVPSQGGKVLAGKLWEARLALATQLAEDIQKGVVGLATDDFVGQTVRIAQDLVLLPRVDAGSLAADQHHALMRDLLLNSGLFVQGMDGRIEFFHNTLREALAARAITAQTRAEAESMWPVVSRWSDPRWREIVLIALARWSNQGNLASKECWTLMDPIMQGSRRGLQFVGMAIAEGVQIPREHEKAVIAALFMRLGAWNPCEEIFAEFKSPNPLDVLRLLTRRERFVALLVDQFKEEPGKCRIRMWAFLELTLDKVGAEAVRPFLQKERAVALAAAVLLVRAGDHAEAQVLLIDALHDSQDENATRERRRIVETIAEHCPPETLWRLLGIGDIAVELRLLAAIVGWTRFKDDRLQAEAFHAFAFSQLDPWSATDVALARRALRVPRLLDKRPHVEATCMTLLAALGGPLSGDRESLPDWVRAICANSDESEELRALASCAVLYVEPDNAEVVADARALATRPSLANGARRALLEVFASCDKLDALEHVANCSALPLATRVSATLAQGEHVATRKRIEKLLVLMQPGSDDWRSCITLMAEAGYIHIAADKIVQRILDEGLAGHAQDIRTLLDFGCGEHIGCIVRAHCISPFDQQFAIRCLGQLGDAQQLLAIMRDESISAPVRLHAAAQMRELGWMQESLAECRRIGAQLGASHLESELQEMESYAMALEVAKGEWPVVVLAAMASKTRTHSAIWQSRLLGLLGHPGLPSRDALAIVEAMGVDLAPFDLALERCRQDPSDGGVLVELADLALSSRKYSEALTAIAAALPYVEGNCFSSVRILHHCADVVAENAIGVEGRDDSRRLFNAAALGRRQWLGSGAFDIWKALLQNDDLPIDDRLDAVYEAIESQSDFTRDGATAALIELVADGSTICKGPPDEVWSRVARISDQLALRGETVQASEVALMPLKHGYSTNLNDENCVASILCSARYGTIDPIENELHMIAFNDNALESCFAAAGALVRGGRSQHRARLIALCLGDPDALSVQRALLRAAGIEAMIEGGALVEAADTALDLVQWFDNDQELRNTFQGLWGRATLRHRVDASRPTPS